MKILLVTNNYFIRGNGLASSARRTVKKLIEAGEEVRVVSGPNPYKDDPKPDYELKVFHFPFFQWLIYKQGFLFAKFNKKVLKEAIEWADVVHLEDPFVLQIKTAKLARKMHKVCTGTYHLHPENIFNSIHLGKSRLLNGIMMRIWKKQIFNHCEIVQCPTQNVYERLVRHHFKAELRIISNGLLTEELMQRTEEVSKTNETNDAKYRIITIGRYSVEKSLKTLLKAMKYSKYAKETQLIIAGKGPKERRLKKRADKYLKKGFIKYPVIFGFYQFNDLQQISSTADLYVHCAFVEVEGLSCMEAIQIGLVPIIAEGKYTATPQFALSEKSLYKQKDAKDLASKIDYWFDHDEERKTEAKKYFGIGEKYNIDYSIKELRKMFKDAYKKYNK